MFCYPGKHGQKPHPAASTHLLCWLKKKKKNRHTNTQPLKTGAWCSKSAAVTSRIQWKVRVALLPGCWGQQTNFFLKFLGLNSKAKLMELFLWQPPPPPNSRTVQTLDHFSFEKMAVTQPWLWLWLYTYCSFLWLFRIANTLANSFCFLWNRSWTNGVTTGLQWKNTSDKGLICRLLNVLVCLPSLPYYFRMSQSWTGGF